MTGVWKRGPVPQPTYTLKLAETTCDRCGEPSTIFGAGSARAWGEAIAHVQGEGAYYADLCHDCAAALRQWVDAGTGGGMQDAITRANEPARSETVGSIQGTSAEGKAS